MGWGLMGWGLMGWLLVSGCWVNPASGRAELALITERDEVRLGMALDRQIREAMGLYEHEALAEFVSSTGLALAENAERSYLPWAFRVLDDPSPNAFALPGGYVYVTRGLLALLASGDELAAVLAHEIGHITARHSVNQISKSHLASRGLGWMRIVDPRSRHLGAFARRSINLRFLRHSRADEFEADDLGVRYMARSRHDPGAVLAVLETLGRLGTADHGGRVPSHLSTHPDPVLRLDRQARGLGVAWDSADWADAKPDAQYLSLVDDIPYGNDPRRGFLIDTRFVHPDGELSFEFPKGWNVKAVGGTAIAADHEQAAMIMVGTTDQDSAEAAEAAFFSADGFVRTGPWVDRIRGNRVRAHRFEVVGEDTRLKGWAVFAQWRGQVQLALGILNAEQESRKRAALTTAIEQSLLSLDKLREVKLRKVETMRLAVVKLRSATTLREYTQEASPSVDLATMVLLNRAPADAPLGKGRQIKTVRGFNPEL